MVLAVSAVLGPVMLAGSVSAQSNPFVPPQSSVSRDQIQQIVRQEVEKARANQATTPTKQAGTKGHPGGPATAGQPAGGVQSQMKGPVDGLGTQQGGSPSASTAAGGPGRDAQKPTDPVAELLKDSGLFVGCVGNTPVFKDKVGRRAYFTSKELRESNAARRYTRCG